MANEIALLTMSSGEEVKTSDNGIVEGYGIVFGDENKTDRSSKKDFFTQDSYIRRGSSFDAELFYEHSAVIKEPVGYATLTKDNHGWKALAEIDLSTVNGKLVYEAVKSSPHGFSTGALPHTVIRIPKANGSNWLKQWNPAEISLTVNPAESRAVVTAIKSNTDNIWQEETQVKLDSPESIEGLMKSLQCVLTQLQTFNKSYIPVANIESHLLAKLDSVIKGVVAPKELDSDIEAVKSVLLEKESELESVRKELMENKSAFETQIQTKDEEIKSKSLELEAATVQLNGLMLLLNK